MVTCAGTWLIQIARNSQLHSINDYVERDTTALEYEIFVLRHFHELNLAEIASIVDQPLTNVHRILTGLTGKIRRIYGPSDG